MANEYHDERQEHAPGPWRVLVSMPLEFRIVADTWKGEITLCKGECLYRHNARLMAAAPELLEALEYLLSQFGKLDHLTDYSAGDKARAAIAKAKRP
jgi:hypothetical protein